MRLFAIAALAAAVLPGGAAWAGDAEAGARVFRTQCGACHVVEAGKNRVGPSMFGIVGRVSGTVEGFRYSAANRDAKLTWTPEVLDKYLVNPRETIPGTTMAYVGLKNATQRADLIAYLETLK
ncbi:MAG: cytochrome c family protein [Alphaproteobacteria bacterium]|nr:cytochrome c family protein [Alphaproteobacteria bacterium]